jgi:hypothetical protein
LRHYGRYASARTLSAPAIRVAGSGFTAEAIAMKLFAALLVVIPLMCGCISSSSPPAPAKATTVIVPADSKTVVICSDGSHPPCD